MGYMNDIDILIEEIRDAVVDTLQEFPDAPETDVTREVAINMLYGESAAVQKQVRQRLGV